MVSPNPVVTRGDRVSRLQKLDFRPRSRQVTDQGEVAEEDGATGVHLDRQLAGIQSRPGNRSLRMRMRDFLVRFIRWVFPP